MDDIKNVYIAYTLLPFFAIGIVLMILLLLINSSGGDATAVVQSGMFEVPFPDGTSYTITSPYGERVDPFDDTLMDYHYGIDLSAYNSDIVASADGTVITVGSDDDGLGEYVIIEHSINGLIFYTVYGHLLEDSIVVIEGQMIKEKEKIGVIGNSGSSTGTHLHFAILVNSVEFLEENFVDPTYIFE